MKNLFLFLLLLTISCKKDDSSIIEESARSKDPSDQVTDPITPATSWSEEFLLLVNSRRASLGLRALIHNDQMGLIAQEHSKNMATGVIPFGHTGFSGRCSQARAALGGGNWCAENVAAGQKTPKSAFDAWMNSAGHKANIESSKATHTGFGYAKTAGGKLYWTQIFLQY